MAERPEDQGPEPIEFKFQGICVASSATDGPQLAFPSESCIPKGSWLSFLPALLFGGATDWQILGCIPGHNRDIHSGGRGSRAGLWGLDFLFISEDGEGRVTGGPWVFLTSQIYACTRAKGHQLCPPLCDLRDCSPSDSSVQGIPQVKILSELLYSSPGIGPRSPALQADSLLAGRPVKSESVSHSAMSNSLQLHGL